jgi:predicted AAA+ superfamily ATPase
MKNTPRYLSPYILEDLNEKMVFLGGPRQVGKTTLAKSLINSKNDYYNWDDLNTRPIILKNQINNAAKIVVLDEIHKYRNWRTLVKGYYDINNPDSNLLVTGSARLDHFRKGGDSLVGRYHYYRMHPFSLPEISKKCENDIIKDLLKFGGFPEPYLKQNEREWRRWKNERVSRVVTQDLQDLEHVKEISLIELLVEQLNPRVSSSLSIKSLQEDLQVSPNTVDRWITILENLYYCFRISPYGTNRVKAVKKTQKLYLWDWSEVENAGAKFENLMASQLLKFCHFHEDYNGHKMELRYLKDVEGREVDFVVIKDKKPMFGVECKTGERELSKSLRYYQDRLKIPKMYQVHLGKKDFGNPAKGGRVIPFSKFCIEEEMI